VWSSEGPWDRQIHIEVAAEAKAVTVKRSLPEDFLAFDDLAVSGNHLAIRVANDWIQVRTADESIRPPDVIAGPVRPDGHDILVSAGVDPKCDG
jgi:hypothetical protein